MDRFREGLITEADDEMLLNLRRHLLMSGSTEIPDDAFQILPQGIQNMLRPKTMEQFVELREFILGEIQRPGTTTDELRDLSHALLCVVTRWVEHEGKK